MKISYYIAIMVTAMAAMVSCDDGKSYAELLTEQDMYVNNFLADNKVELSIPADTVFICGEDAPYYRLDEDGEMYMQVLNPGTKGNKVQSNEQVYFRYTRYALSGYKNGRLPEGQGNDITLNPCWFRYNNYQIEASYTWGYGIQYPLSLLPLEAEVNIVIKSQMGPTNEQSDVQPYLWKLRYQRRQ